MMLSCRGPCPVVLVPACTKTLDGHACRLLPAFGHARRIWRDKYRGPEPRLPSR